MSKNDRRPRQDPHLLSQPPPDPYARDPYGQRSDGGSPYEQNAYGQEPGRLPPKRRRTALIVILSILGLCLLVCVGGVVYAFTQIGPGIRDSVSELTSTEVASQLDQAGAARPGNYVITDEELTAGINRQLAADGNSGSIQGVEVAIDPTGIEIVIDLGGQTAGYRAGLGVEDGEIRVTDPEADAGIIGNLIPTDWIAGGLQDGLNAYFEANNLTVTSIELAQGQVQIATEQRCQPTSVLRPYCMSSTLNRGDVAVGDGRKNLLLE